MKRKPKPVNLVQSCCHFFCPNRHRGAKPSEAAPCTWWVSCGVTTAGLSRDLLNPLSCAGEPAAPSPCCAPALAVPGINSRELGGAWDWSWDLRAVWQPQEGVPIAGKERRKSLEVKLLLQTKLLLALFSPNYGTYWWPHGIFTRLVKSELLASVNVENKVRLPSGKLLLCMILYYVSQYFPGKSKDKYYSLLSVCRCVTLCAGNKPPKACCYTIHISS